MPEGPLRPSLRRRSVQVGSLAYRRSRAEAQRLEREAELAGGEAAPPSPRGPARGTPAEGGIPWLAQKDPRAFVSFAHVNDAAPARGAEPRGRPRSASLLRKSVAVADVQGVRTRSGNGDRAGLLASSPPTVSVGVFGGALFELCPVSRKSFVVPSTSFRPVLGAHPERPPSGPSARAPDGSRADAVAGPPARVVWPSPAKHDFGMHQPLEGAAGGNGTASPDDGQAPGTAKSRKQPKKGGFFKRLFH